MNESRELYYAVREAIRNGWTVKQFLNQAREFWDDALSEKHTMDMDEFRKATK